MSKQDFWAKKRTSVKNMTAMNKCLKTNVEAGPMNERLTHEYASRRSFPIGDVSVSETTFLIQNGSEDVLGLNSPSETAPALSSPLLSMSTAEPPQELQTQMSSSPFLLNFLPAFSDFAK